MILRYNTNRLEKLDSTDQGKPAGQVDVLRLIRRFWGCRNIKLFTGFIACFFMTCTVTMGERRATGECPEGEICSDLTPRGLYFAGSVLSGGSMQPVSVTAVGGQQTITVLTSSRPDSFFRLPFEVALTDDNVFSVESLDPPRFTLQGIQSGTSLLRVVDPSSGELFDRISVVAAPIYDRYLRAKSGETRVQGSWAFYNGTMQGVFVVLLDAMERRLVDETMIITHLNPGEVGDFTQVEWDLFQLEGFEPGIVEVMVQTGDGDSFNDEVSLVDMVDDVYVKSASPEDGVVMAGFYANVCFRAENDGVVVLGAPWEFEVSGIGASGGEPFFGANCVFVRTESPGMITVTGTALGFSASVEFQIVAAMKQNNNISGNSEPGDFPFPRIMSTPGERAERTN